MAIGERIHFFRSMRGMTQKYLGQLMGFPEKSADVRLAQYETGTRTPKANFINSLANALDVSPLALSVPDIDSYLGLMHTLFTLEDRYGLHIDEADGEVCLKVDVRKKRMPHSFTKCCVLGDRLLPCSKPGRLRRRNMTDGVTAILSSITRSAGRKYLPRHSVICL